jgi:hypothetical protein
MHTQRGFFWGGVDFNRNIQLKFPTHGRAKIAGKLCLANYEGRRPLGKLRHKWRIILTMVVK